MSKTALPAMRKPSALLYLVCLAVFVAGGAGFAFAVQRERARTAAAIDGFQRFIAPGSGVMSMAENGVPNHSATIIEIKEPGEYTVFYESFGVHRENSGDRGETFDTPTDQLWPVRAKPSMTLAVTRADGADSGQKMEMRPAGVEADAKEQERVEGNPRFAMPKNRGLVMYRREQTGRDGHGLWLLDIEKPGLYQFETRYVEGIHADPALITVPPDIKGDREKLRTMRQHEIDAYEKARREAQEALALAKVEPLPVLLALGKDPIGQRLFEPTGFYGITALCAFGMTLSVAGAILVAAMRSRKA